MNRLLLVPLASLALTGCSAEDRAERRVRQIEAEIDAKAEAGTLTADDFEQAMDEMVELTEPALEQRRREEAARLERERRERDEGRERQAREREAQQEQARLAAAARLEEIRPQATAAVEGAAAHYDELLNALRTLADAQPSRRRLVEHEIANQERAKNRRLNQLRNLLDDRDNLASVEAALHEAQLIPDYLQPSIDDTNARLSSLQHPDTGGTVRPPQPAAGDTPAAPPPDPSPEAPTIEELRAEATTAMNEVETLHDELIDLLEAVAAAQHDDQAQRQAAGAVTLAQLAKRQDMDRLRADADAAEQWRVEGAITHAARVRDQLQAEIAAAKQR